MIEERCMCAQCGYDLRGTNERSQCPECGFSVRESIREHEVESSRLLHGVFGLRSVAYCAVLVLVVLGSGALLATPLAGKSRMSLLLLPFFFGSIALSIMTPYATVRVALILLRSRHYEAPSMLIRMVAVVLASIGTVVLVFATCNLF